MSFLGIDYDKWHGIIAFGLVLILMIIISLWLPFSKQESYLIAVIISSFFVFFLQALNESIQALDSDIEFKYGSWKNFQQNSRKDWAYTIKGWSLGLFFGTLIFIGV